MAYITKDSGKREDFPTGAKRDTRTGKGRFDLIPSRPLRRMAEVYERGSTKYGDRNWEKGFPYSRCLDSALRHLNQFRDGAIDEDHLAQACFNLFAIMHFQELRPDLNDMPDYAHQAEIARCVHEQARCAAEAATDPGAALGVEDWTKEEVLLRRA